MRASVLAISAMAVVMTTLGGCATSPWGSAEVIARAPRATLDREAQLDAYWRERRKDQARAAQYAAQFPPFPQSATVDWSLADEFQQGETRRTLERDAEAARRAAALAAWRR